MKEQFIQIKGRTSTSTSTITTITLIPTPIVKNPTSLTINSNIARILLTNTVKKTIPLDLDKTPLDLNAPFVYNLIRNNIIGNSKVSRHSFNNLKWFQTIYPFNKPYKIFNVNNIVIYDIGDVVNILLRTSGGSSVNFRL